MPPDGSWPCRLRKAVQTAKAKFRDGTAKESASVYAAREHRGEDRGSYQNLHLQASYPRNIYCTQLHAHY